MIGGRVPERSRLTFVRPIDEVKSHAAPQHFGFEISSVQFPFVGIADTEWPVAIIPFESIVRREGSTDALIHHEEALVCESLIIH